MIVLGYGWSVLPRFVIAPQLDAETLIPIPGPISNPVTPYHMLWIKRAQRNPRTALARTMTLEQFPG